MTKPVTTSLAVRKQNFLAAIPEYLAEHPLLDTDVEFIVHDLPMWVQQEDAFWFNEMTWYPDWNEDCQTFYARTKTGWQTAFRLHHLILDPPEGFTADHLYFNGLDNRRRYLEPKTQRQQCAHIRRPTASQYPGAYKTKNKKKWEARMTLNGRWVYLGTRDTELEAAALYRDAVAAA